MVKSPALDAAAVQVSRASSSPPGEVERVAEGEQQVGAVRERMPRLAEVRGRLECGAQRDHRGIRLALVDRAAGDRLLGERPDAEHFALAALPRAEPSAGDELDGAFRVAGEREELRPRDREVVAEPDHLRLGGEASLPLAGGDAVAAGELVGLDEHLRVGGRRRERTFVVRRRGSAVMRDVVRSQAEPAVHGGIAGIERR